MKGISNNLSHVWENWTVKTEFKSSRASIENSWKLSSYKKSGLFD